MSDEHEISADLALETIARLRKRGGAGRLWQTAIALLGTLVFATGIDLAPTIASALMLGAAALGCGAIIVRNLVQNSFIDPRQARMIRRLEGPRSAVLIGNRLLVGTTGHSRVAWCEVVLSAREVRELRTLALPAARVIDE